MVARSVAPSVRRDALTRRRFLGGLAAGTLAASGLASCVAIPKLPDLAGRDPFTLGVAAGEPGPDGFVLWTRLAPEPLWPDPAAPGGLTAGDVVLRYDIAADDGMRTIVQSGDAVAEAAYAHSVHLEVRGLPPGRPYWYRFTGGRAQSRIGRAWTAPAAGQPLGQLRFGFVSCANYEHGYFAAYRHLADEAPDLVLFLGDYIYEYVERSRPTVRRHSDDVEATTLPTYRNRYAQYRLDPDLQRLHAQSPALITWDDHEVQDDYADRWSATFDAPEDFLRRRAAAYQAFYEHMPLRPGRSRPQGPALRLYDRFAYGDLVEFSVLDERQYRSREACARPPNAGGGHVEFDALCSERRDPSRSILGAPQEAWLFDGLARSEARWNILAQGVLMAQLRQRVPPIGIVGHWTDAWDGYPGQPRPAPRPPGGEPRLEPGRAQRRPSLLLGQRPEEGLRRSRLADRGHGVRRHVDLLDRAAVRGVHGVDARQSSCALLRQPAARVHLRRADARAHDHAPQGPVGRPGPPGHASRPSGATSSSPGGPARSPPSAKLRGQALTLIFRLAGRQS